MDEKETLLLRKREAETRLRDKKLLLHEARRSASVKRSFMKPNEYNGLLREISELQQEVQDANHDLGKLKRSNTNNHYPVFAILFMDAAREFLNPDEYSNIEGEANRRLSELQFKREQT